MKIGLQTWGSDGDIFPFLTLAAGLSAKGHEVTLAYTSVDGKDYLAFGESGNFGIINASLDQDASSGNIYALSNSTRPLTELIVLLEKCYNPATEIMYAASEELCKTNNLVIGHILCHTLLTASQKYKCKRVALALSPMAIRSMYVSPIGQSLGTWVNSFLWKVGDTILTKKCFGPAKQLRKREGLSAIKSLHRELFISDNLTLIASSRIFSNQQPDWKENIETCGVLQAPSLNAPNFTIPWFEGKGDLPVYFTFGSCTQFETEQNTKLFVEAVKLAGIRAIIQSDHPQINDPTIIQVGRVSHHRIFKECSLIVHHGGAGTTHASLQAGKPSVVVAHAFDQPYWGKQLQRMGVAGKTLFRKTVTAEQLARAITDTLKSTEICEKAIEIGGRMRKEDGLATAIELIESHSSTK